MRRVFFDKFFEWMKEMGYTDRKRASELLDDLIEAGLAEGNDEIGYILTLARAEKKLYGSFVFSSSALGEILVGGSE